MDIEDLNDTCFCEIDVIKTASKNMAPILHFYVHYTYEKTDQLHESVFFVVVSILIVWVAPVLSVGKTIHQWHDECKECLRPSLF